MLEEYKSKRNFQVTAEPSATGGKREGSLRFVVQKHAARRLHYDLRLELDGVLLSWAVPKGPSLNVNDKRLAVQTEDHPLEYKAFEGVIPEGEYGAGSMIIWDNGTYLPDWNHVKTPGKKDEEAYLRKGVAEGKITFVLRGQKLHGSWTLFRLGKSGKDWLLRKNDDEFANDSEDLTKLDRSIVSGRTIEEVSQSNHATARIIDCSVQSPRAEPLRCEYTPKLDDVLNQLEGDQDKVVVHVEGHDISFSNLNKTFWPATAAQPSVTKRVYAQYLVRTAPYLLPHLRNRPITLLRYPNGIDGPKFYQKHWEHKLPAFVETVDLFGQDADADQEYMVCNNLATLLWLAQLADLELHTWHSRTMPDPHSVTQSTKFTGTIDNLRSSILNYPDFLAFDLDPYIYSGKEKTGDEPELNELAFKRTCEVAKLIKEILDSINATSFVKTTGKTGLHLYVPIVRNLDFDMVRDLSEAIGRLLLKEHPDLVTLEWAVAKRTGKIFVDCNMNARGKTLASIYSPRVHRLAPVSIPLKWTELDDIYPTDFTIHTANQRLEKTGDLWAKIHEQENDLSQVFHATQTNKPKSKRRQRR